MEQREITLAGTRFLAVVAPIHRVHLKPSRPREFAVGSEVQAEEEGSDLLPDDAPDGGGGHGVVSVG